MENLSDFSLDMLLVNKPTLQYRNRNKLLHLTGHGKTCITAYCGPVLAR